MKDRVKWMMVGLALALSPSTFSQGTFQNLDFENGVFVPIPDDPFGRVEFSAAMPGWTGYLGENQIGWVLHNNLFLSDAGIAIFGPNNPEPDWLHGEFFVVLQNAFPVPTETSAIAQTGMLPSDARSIRFYTVSQFVLPMIVSFDGNQIPISLLGATPNNQRIWGGDISSFAGQTGELRFSGQGYLDYIQFSTEAVPEPSVLGLFAFGALLLCWQLRQRVKG